MKTTILTTVGVLLTATSAHAVLYFQGFDNTGTTYANIDTVDWGAYGGPDAEDVSVEYAGGETLGENVAISFGAGAGSPNGFLVDSLISGTSGSPNLYLDFSEDVEILISGVSGFSYAQQHDSTSSIGYFALAIDDGLNTDTSVKFFRSLGASVTSTTAWETTSIAATGNNWVQIFLTDTSMDLNPGGTAVALNPTHTILGVGLASTQPSGVVRFDNVTIVPEPAPAGLLGLAGLGLLARRRR